MWAFALQWHCWIFLTKTVWKENWKYFLSGLLKKRFADPWSMTFWVLESKQIIINLLKCRSHSKGLGVWPEILYFWEAPDDANTAGLHTPLSRKGSRQCNILDRALVLSLGWLCPTEETFCIVTTRRRY